jgi:ABC transport system ATP-binding/permease protein
MPSGPVLAQAMGVRLTLGGAALFDDVSFALHKGSRAALIGANGAGKSTLLAILSRRLIADGGGVTLANGTRIATMPQEPDLSGFAKLLNYVTAAPDVAVYEAQAALEGFGLDPERGTSRLSGGEVRRASLAQAFAQAPDLLLLDEPTNHLDIPAITQLEARLQRFSGAALIISHDRRFLEAVSTQCLWLRRRRVFGLDAGFDRFEAWAEEIEAAEERAAQKLDTQLKAEERWLQRGVTARRSRNEGRRRKLMSMRAEKRSLLAEGEKTATITAAVGSEGGRLAIEAVGLSKAITTPEGGTRTLIADLSLKVMRGDRVGIIGPNGAGKTTLLDILLQKAPPDAGRVRHGSGLTLAYVDQMRAFADPNKTVWDTLCPLGGDQVMAQGRPRHVASYAGDFLFSSGQLRQPTHALSGGERNRLALAVALAQPSNLLVLDEPTNDLDMETLDVLEEMLASYQGTVLVVSHDRAFLDGVATQILGPISQARWALSPGGYGDFVREHGAMRGPEGKAAAVSAPKPAVSPRPSLTKLTFKETRRMAALEAAMTALPAEIAQIEARLSAPDAYVKDPTGDAAAAKRLDAARGELDAAETEWLELEERRAALAAGGD